MVNKVEYGSWLQLKSDEACHKATSCWKSFCCCLYLMKHHYLPKTCMCFLCFMRLFHLVVAFLVAFEFFSLYFSFFSCLYQFSFFNDWNSCVASSFSITFIMTGICKSAFEVYKKSCEKSFLKNALFLAFCA